MKEEFDKKLVEAFPLLYGDRHASKQSTAMCWGFSCNDGWFEIIWNLSSKLEPLIQKFIDENPAAEVHPRASQVKEKFGGLRFYMTHINDEIRDLIGETEALSYKICEDCGKPGEERDAGWIFTHCDGCHENWEERRNNSLLKAANKVMSDYKNTFQKLAHGSPCLGCGCNPCDCGWGYEE